MVPPKEFQRPVPVRQLAGETGITGLYSATGGRYVGVTPPLGAEGRRVFAIGKLTGKINSWDGQVYLGLVGGYKAIWEKGTWKVESLKSGVKVPGASMLYTDGTLYRQNTARFLRGYKTGRRFAEELEQAEFVWASEKKRVAFLGGVHGVGKGTALGKADTNRLNIMGFSDIMKGLVAGLSRDDLNRKSYEERRGMVDKVYDIILETAPPGVIVDSHFTLPIRDKQEIGIERWEVGLPARYIPYITDFILVTAEAGQVYERRSKDPAGRRITTKPLIHEELENELSGGRAAAGLAGRFLHVVDNSGPVEEAAIELTRIFASATD